MWQVNESQGSGEAKFRVSTLVRSDELHKRGELRFIFNQFLEASSDNILPSSPDLKISAPGQLIDLVNPSLMVDSKDQTNLKLHKLFKKVQDIAIIAHARNDKKNNITTCSVALHLSRHQR